MEKATGNATLAASSGAAAAPEGSNVREAFKLMTTLIYPKIPVPFLDLSAKILQRRHLETVFEERSVQYLCGFPACGKRLDECVSRRQSIVVGLRWCQRPADRVACVS